MSSIIRSRNCDMVVSFVDVPTGRLDARRIKRIHLPANYPDRAIQLPLGGAVPSNDWEWNNAPSIDR